MKCSTFSNKIMECSIYMCPQCVFNHDGNVFAAVSDKLINICNIRTGEKVHLNGHINKVSTFHHHRACLQVCPWVNISKCGVSLNPVIQNKYYKWVHVHIFGLQLMWANVTGFSGHIPKKKKCLINLWKGSKKYFPLYLKSEEATGIRKVTHMFFYKCVNKNIWNN